MGHTLGCFGRLSEASRTSAPMRGVKKRLQKKYPQNPNFRSTPIQAMRKQSPTYTITTSMAFPRDFESARGRMPRGLPQGMQVCTKRMDPLKQRSLSAACCEVLQSAAKENRRASCRKHLQTCNGTGGAHKPDAAPPFDQHSNMISSGRDQASVFAGSFALRSFAYFFPFAYCSAK